MPRPWRNFAAAPAETVGLLSSARSVSSSRATMMPKKLYSFKIDPELREGLKALKRRDGASEGESCRRALADYLQRKGVMKKAGRKRA